MTTQVHHKMAPGSSVKMVNEGDSIRIEVEDSEFSIRIPAKDLPKFLTGDEIRATCTYEAGKWI